MAQKNCGLPLGAEDFHKMGDELLSSSRNSAQVQRLRALTARNVVPKRKRQQLLQCSSQRAYRRLVRNIRRWIIGVDWELPVEAAGFCPISCPSHVLWAKASAVPGGLPLGLVVGN